MFVNYGLFLKSALEEVGWIDEDHYQFYHADGDLCLKLWQKGYEVIDCPRAFVEHFIHFGTKIRNKNLFTQQADWQTYIERWKGTYYFPDQPKGDDWICMSAPNRFNNISPFPKRWIYLLKIRRIYHILKIKLSNLMSRFSDR
jgi:GT2 family glycosyltransferase